MRFQLKPIFISSPTRIARMAFDMFFVTGAIWKDLGWSSLEFTLGVALAFISFWRAAAIVLCDLASTAYYIGGISEEAIGKAAPWFILGVMLFSYAVRAVYVLARPGSSRGPEPEARGP